MRARYYDPQQKRFTQEDPIGYAGGVNLYAYTTGNPLEATDPSGLNEVKGTRAEATYADPFKHGGGGLAEAIEAAENAWEAAMSRSETTIIEVEYADGHKVSYQASEVELVFDGATLTMVGKDGKAVGAWSGVSGRSGFQDPRFVALQDKGPIPEGLYAAKQSRYQQFPSGPAGDWQTFLGVFDRGQWRGGKTAWGSERVWLDPLPGTETFHRGGFSIHGGTYPGSAGCIDLGYGMGNFAQAFKNAGHDMVLRVDY